MAENLSPSDFDRGRENGRFAAARPLYEQAEQPLHEQYITHSLQLAAYRDRLASKQAELQKRETTQATARQTRDELARTETGAALREELVAKRLAVVLNKISQTDAEQRQTEAERASLRPAYSVAAGLLFLLAGVVFMAGDLVISHDIVAYALNIRNSTEAWAFAGGLAALSLLAKPAYDRLIEAPYLENNSPAAGRRYRVFKGLLLLLAVGTLFVLGWFRYEAYRTNQIKADLNRTVRALQSAEPSAETLQQTERLLRQGQQLNLELVNSPWGRFSFVLTGILFALAGAVCLGISLPVLTAYVRRWAQLPRLQRRQRRQSEELAATLLTLEDELLAVRTQRTTCQLGLAQLAESAEETAERTELRSQIEALLGDITWEEQQMRIAQYQDGYARGQAEAEGGITSPELPTEPAHLALRRVIAQSLGTKSTANAPHDFLG